MKLTVHWMDFDDYLGKGQQPVVMIEREQVDPERPSNGGAFQVARLGRVGTYWVPKTSVLTLNAEWSMIIKGEIVPVPIVGFRTAVAAPGAILATGIEIGMKAVESLKAYYSGKVEEVTLILGQSVHRIPEANVYQVYVGLAVRVD